MNAAGRTSTRDQSNILFVIAIISGCSTALPYGRHDDGCLADRHGVWPESTTLSRGGRRVPDEDLVAATADNSEATRLASDSRHMQQLALGSFLAGGMLFAPGIGLTAFGMDDHQSGSMAAGAVITAAGAAGLVAGLVLINEAGRRRDRAIGLYNAEAPSSCRAN